MPSLDALVLFSILYVTAILSDIIESWEYIWFTAAYMVLGTVFVFYPRRPLLFVLLGAITCYHLVSEFPDVSNHVNLMIICNIVLMAALVHGRFQPLLRDDDVTLFGAIAPIMRLMIILTFSIAGFHKFNHDFINPAVSCALPFTLPFLSVGAFVGYALVGVVVAVMVWRHASHPVLPKVDTGGLVFPVLALLTLAVVLLNVADAGQLDSLGDYLLLLIPIAVLCWQLVEAPLLLFRRFQWFALCVCLIAHTHLAVLGRYDLQALSIALLMTFMPLDVLKAWDQRRTVRLFGIAVHRVHCYFGLIMLTGILNGIDLHVVELPTVLGKDMDFFEGLIFDIGLLILLWPIVVDLFSRDRAWRWSGVQVFDRRTPAALYVAPAALILFGLTPYLGLRTAGNLSMYSNVRTEGEVSNHLILGQNPLKFAGYQEDVVIVHEMFDAEGKVGGVHFPLEGMALPVVEFRKFLWQTKQAPPHGPMRVEYRGEIYQIDDARNETIWNVDGRDWEMWLMDFRAIQPDRPNSCRW